MSEVLVEKDDRTLKIHLNRPERKNAFGPAMIEELTEAFTLASSDESISLVTLTGEGTAFSAGADLGWMKSMVDFNLEENLADSNKLFDMFSVAFRCPALVVGFFQGYVMGGATGLAAICDIGVAAQNTKFCFSEVKLGLAPAVISPYILKKMNANKANEFMLSAKMFDSDEALSSGLVNYIESGDVVGEVYNKTVSRHLKTAPVAVRSTKKMLREMEINQIESVRKLTTTTSAERRVSGEGQEGPSCFFEKTNPSWRQK